MGENTLKNTRIFSIGGQLATYLERACNMSLKGSRADI